VDVEAFGSIGEHPYTVTAMVCGDCCNYQVPARRGRRSMGFLKTETRMDGGGAAAKREYERELEIKNQKIGN
jgi:hypothetical protein